LSDTSPASSSFLVDLAKSLSAGVVFFASKCWGWVPLSTIAVFLLALGISAMYGTQYILAAGFYFVGIALLTARLAADAKSHARKGGVIFVVVSAGALIFSGSLWLVKHTYETQGHSDNVLSAAISSAALLGWDYISHMWQLPWRWIVGSVLFGFVLAAIANVWRSRKQEPASENGGIQIKGTGTVSDPCPDEWLHEKLKTDKTTIWDLVWVASIFYRRDFDKSQPRIDFVFNIINNSLLDVVLSMEGGYILFSDENEQFHFEPKFIARNPALCRSRDTMNFVIRQAVTGDEIKNHFKEADNTRISFGNLFVTFRGTEQFPEITATNLDVNHYLFTKEGAWYNPNRPKFLTEQESGLRHIQAAPPVLPPETPKDEPKHDLAVVPDSPPRASSGNASELASLMSALLQPRSMEGMSIQHSACGVEETLVHSRTMAVADAYERTYGNKEEYVCAGVAYAKFYRDDNASGSSVNVFAQIEFLDTAVSLVNPLFVVDKGYWFKVSKPHSDRAQFQIGDPEQLIIAVIRPDNLVLPYSGHNVFSGDEWEFAFNGQGFTAKEVLIRIKLIARTWGGEAAYRRTFEYVLTTGDVPAMRRIQAVA